MFIPKADYSVKDVANMRGGDGTIHQEHFATGTELPPHSRLMATLTFEPGCSIGEHEHINETELFYVLEGEFIALDGGKEVTLREGDSLLTGGGAAHSIRNNTSKTAKLLAVIVTE